LAEALNISRVIIGSVGYQSPEAALQEVGVEAARYLHRIINPKTIIGLTGGSSIEAVINGYKIDWGGKAFEVIPARGGLGNKAEHQANTLAERLAGKLGADYQLLYTQDNFSKSTIEELKNEPNIIKILEAIDEIDILLFGVGRADVMASRRSLEQSEIDDILRKGAVAESFGYYFNQNGDIVHEISTIGIGLNKYKSLKSAIAVAADVNKAEAIIAISKLNPNLVLVTDEQTALKIQEYFN
jgi:central glycolytic genes regulator